MRYQFPLTFLDTGSVPAIPAGFGISGFFCQLNAVVSILHIGPTLSSLIEEESRAVSPPESQGEFYVFLLSGTMTAVEIELFVGFLNLIKETGGDFQNHTSLPRFAQMLTLMKSEAWLSKHSGQIITPYRVNQKPRVVGGRWINGWKLAHETVTPGPNDLLFIFKEG